MEWFGKRKGWAGGVVRVDSGLIRNCFGERPDWSSSSIVRVPASFPRFLFFCLCVSISPFNESAVPSRRWCPNVCGCWITCPLFSFSFSFRPLRLGEIVDVCFTEVGRPKSATSSCRTKREPSHPTLAFPITKPGNIQTIQTTCCVESSR